VRKVDAQYMFGRAGTGDRVQVGLDLTFFAGSALEATSHMDLLTSTLRSKEWVLEVQPRATKEFDEGGETGIYVDGYTLTCDLSTLRKEEDQP